LIKGISYLSFEKGLANTESLESVLAQTKTFSFDALELGISTDVILTTNTTKAEKISIETCSVIAVET